MTLLSHLFRVLLLFTIPAMAVPFPIDLPAPPPLPPIYSLTYDQILELIDLIDDEEIDDRCTPDQIEKVADLMSFLAWKGTDLNDPFACALLEQDSYTLLCTTRVDPQFFPHDLYTIQPAVYEGHIEATLCKSWVHKQCSQVKKFVKKHKKAIIIGAVVVAVVAVAAVTIIAVAGTTAATSAAATAGAAAAGIAAGQQEDHPPLSPQTSFEPLPPENSIAQTPPPEPLPLLDPPLPESPILTKLIEEKTASLKATLLEEIPSDPLPEPKAQWTWGEKARELGSIVAHQILDTAADVGSLIPEARAELLAVKTYVAPEILNEPADSLFSHQKDPIGDYNATVASLHEKIDEAFSTDKAYLYTPEVKALKITNSKDCAVGMVPPPGILSNFFSTERLLEAGQVFDRAGFTRAGRALMKHGYRESSVFSKPVGNPAQVNEHGQRVLESILNHPERKILHGEFKRHGKVVDIMAPGIGVLATMKKVF
ncbi:MAG: hypothetical protein KGJ02_08415 [Verrucomicrobiota bacterium]|nr:hypothetical protein [Verrucomicrobiota bacterium]